MASGKPASDFDRGKVIGKYEILTRLSVGGMAELYLAFLPGPGGFKKFVALKQILPDVKADDVFVRMFLDEARITAALSHANIGQVFDLGEDPSSGELYLAMEFIAGQNLEQVLRRAARNETPIPVGFAARIVRDACLGLHYAHHFVDPTSGTPMPIIHRDVSPKNVMVTYTGDVKVIDFGIAKARGRLNRTHVGVVKGTSGYMAPEQVRNEPLDGRSDLFAAAVMLHEMVCGERLFTAATDTAMMMKIAEAEAPDPSTVNPAVSAEFARVILKALSKSKDRRFATGKEFARAIEQSCESMFDEDQVAEVMRRLFADKVVLTRSILELADQERDPRRLTQVAEGLAAQDESAPPRRRVTGNLHAKSAATPSGRAALPKRSSGSSQKLPKVRAGPSSSKLPQAHSSNRSSQSLPKPQESRRTLPRVSPGDGEIDERATSQASHANDPSAESTQETSAGSGRQPVWVVVAAALVAVIGIGVWALIRGPFISLGTTDEIVQVDLGPQRIDFAAASNTPKTAKPQWLLEKEAQAAKDAEEKARQQEIEAAANDPDRLAMLHEISVQIEQLNRLEEAQRQLKIEARQGKQNTEANAKKIEELQKQITELREAVKEKEARKAKPKPEGDVEVVRDAKAARVHDIGYLTLRTRNPSSTRVSLAETELGSTPLVKVPLDVGSHGLHLVDGDSKTRFLSVTISAGKTTDLNLDITTLPYVSLTPKPE
jgi:serine/threonine-protein kinase